LGWDSLVLKTRDDAALKRKRGEINHRNIGRNGGKCFTDPCCGLRIYVPPAVPGVRADTDFPASCPERGLMFSRSMNLCRANDFGRLPGLSEIRRVGKEMSNNNLVAITTRSRPLYCSINFRNIPRLFLTYGFTESLLLS